MRKYTLKFTEQAVQDRAHLASFIRDLCHAPLTAKRYIDELLQRIEWLEESPQVFAIVPELTMIYGVEMRRLNYKMMAVLYSVEGDLVIIHRIVPQSMVIY
ncbi:MAG: type II toxin-antitoxin system RelE/ParE family toxin [Paludibacteraceae bacterium]|nr:type II toxin-antitoxin system RelE/ParE family toxin [Paludibacteraceae bacterium]